MKEELARILNELENLSTKLGDGEVADEVELAIEHLRNALDAA